MKQVLAVATYPDDEFLPLADAVAQAMAASADCAEALKHINESGERTTTTRGMTKRRAPLYL